MPSVNRERTAGATCNLSVDAEYRKLPSNFDIKAGFILPISGRHQMGIERGCRPECVDAGHTEAQTAAAHVERPPGQRQKTGESVGRGTYHQPTPVLEQQVVAVGIESPDGCHPDGGIIVKPRQKMGQGGIEQVAVIHRQAFAGQVKTHFNDGAVGHDVLLGQWFRGITSRPGQKTCLT